jgi:hypothetical protein
MASTPGNVTRGLTLKGPELTWAILDGRKLVENRTWRLSPGWYALHSGKGSLSAEAKMRLHALAPDAPEETSLPKSAIVGAIRVSHCLPLEACSQDPWATGPVCNVIAERAMLTSPIPHRGALGTWPISKESIVALQNALEDAPMKSNATALALLGLDKQLALGRKRKRVAPDTQPQQPAQSSL